MNDLVKGYIVTRGSRTGFLTLGVTLCAVLAGKLLPAGFRWLLIPVVLAALIYIFDRIKTTALSFFIASILTIVLFNVPFGGYIEALYGQAKSRTVFMIVLFGAALALATRRDLVDELGRFRKFCKGMPIDDDLNLEEAQLKREIHVFCLLQRFDGWVERVSSSRIVRCGLLFPLALVNFVSSSTAVMFFKSLWAPTGADFIAKEKDRFIAAGILCMCVTGVLVLLMSPWWLFFKSTAAEYAAPKLPIGAWFYGMASYLHGFWLIFVRSRDAGGSAASCRQPADVQTRRMKGLYLVLLCFCALSVAGAVAASWASNPSPTLSHADIVSIAVCTVFLCVILSVLLAQLLMHFLYLRPADDSRQPTSFWKLMVGGMEVVFSTVLTLVVILAFKDILVDAIKRLPDLAEIASRLLSGIGLAEGSWSLSHSSGFFAVCQQAAIIIVPLGVCGVIGRIIGSSWGAFTIGVLVLKIAHADQGGRWIPAVVESLIIVAAFINQRSPNADNVQVMLGADKCTPEAVDSVWSAPTFRDHPGIRAEHVQYAIMAAGIVLSFLLGGAQP